MIRTAIVGVGNCASSLVQGIFYCRNSNEVSGLPFARLGGYAAGEIDIAAAFDIDHRKVGKDLSAAVFAEPNCTLVFQREIPVTGVRVQRGPTLDGIAPHMGGAPSSQSFMESALPALTRDEVVAHLKSTGCAVMINFLPVGAQAATEFYVQCALDAGLAFINAIPVPIASDPAWAARFKDEGLPLLGDDFKAQMGATVLHRTLVHLFEQRGATLSRTYQLNVGGNTDFLNMADGSRTVQKRHSKTESVQSALASRLDAPNIRIGPSDHVPWLNDQKVAFLRLEGHVFGGAPVNLEIRLSVEDSPNAAAMALTAIRCAQIALDQGLAGALWEPSAYVFKHPPRQMSEDDARRALLAFSGDVEDHE